MIISHAPHIRRDEARFVKRCHNQNKEYWICAHSGADNWFEGCCSHNPCQGSTGICNDPGMKYGEDYVLKEDVKPDPWQKDPPEAERPESLGPQFLREAKEAGLVPGSNSDGDGSPPLAAILGGVLGSVAALFIIAALIYLWRGRKKPSEKAAVAAAAAPTIDTSVGADYNTPGGYSELYSPPPTFNTHKRAGSVPGYAELQSPLNTVSSKGGITPDMAGDRWSEQWPYPSPHPESTQATYKRVSGGHSVHGDVHPAYAELPVHSFEPVELAGDASRSPVEHGRENQGLGLQAAGIDAPKGHAENRRNGGEDPYTMPRRVTPPLQTQGLGTKEVDANAGGPHTPLLERGE